MDSSVSAKDEIWFLRVCHHVLNAVYFGGYCQGMRLGNQSRIKVEMVDDQRYNEIKNTWVEVRGTKNLFREWLRSPISLLMYCFKKKRDTVNIMGRMYPDSNNCYSKCPEWLLPYLALEEDRRFKWTLHYFSVNLQLICHMLAFVLVIRPVGGLHMPVHYVYCFCTCFMFCALIDAAGRDTQFFFPVFFFGTCVLYYTAFLARWLFADTVCTCAGK
jgi:hypothetical protein